MFGAARIALSIQRALDNAESRSVNGTIPETTTIPTREALRWITTEGARMLGRENSIGSLTPGKLADLVVINANDLNLVSGARSCLDRRNADEPCEHRSGYDRRRMEKAQRPSIGRWFGRQKATSRAVGATPGRRDRTTGTSGLG
jgi:cytosine/adenosine deaminase-related metal-dependent hydrolase